MSPILILQDFLRNLPDCLLVSSLYDQWVKISEEADEETKLKDIKQ